MSSRTRSRMSREDQELADLIQEANGDINALRPWRKYDSIGGYKTYVTLNTGRKNKDGNWETQDIQVKNASLLMRDEWMEFDNVVMGIAEERLRVWTDISKNTFTVKGGEGSTVLHNHSMGDAGEAYTSMNGLEEENNDRPEYDQNYLPLPYTHAGFRFTRREIAVSRKMGTGLDLTMLERSTRKVVERIEKMTIGTLANYTFGGGTIYGLRTYPNRLTKSLTLPTAPGWSPQLFIQEILDMRQALKDDQFHGPYALYFSPGWVKYLDDDYSAAYGGETLRTRINKIGGFTIIDDADHLPDYEVLMVQLTSDVVRAVTALPLGVIQYDMHGGLARRFKVICIHVPQIRSDPDENTGINHGVAA